MPWSPALPSRAPARVLAVALGASTAVLVAAVPAAAAPAPVSGLAAALAAHGLELTWTGSGAGTPIVRDVTSEAGPYDPAGPALAAAPSSACPLPTCLLDQAFTNTSRHTYAVWATDDGTAATASSSPAILTVDPLPAVATALSLTASPATVGYGERVALSGTLTRAGLPLPGAAVKVLSAVPGQAPALLTTLTSGPDGAVGLAYVPTRSRAYQLVYDGDAFSAGSTSTTQGVTLTPRSVARLTPATAEWQQPAVLYAGFAPAFAGQTVFVQRWTGAAWANLTSRVLSPSSTTTLALRPAVGRHRYRVVLPGASDHLAGISDPVVLTVVPRTLSEGGSGPDVLAVERRLAQLHYDVGRVDGVFDGSTRHAVTAFQKVEGLPRTGRWGGAERKRALHPRGFRVHFRDGRLTVEVDITRQVVVLVRNGAVLTISDASTGSDRVYYQQGVRNIARTPRGVFTVFFKVDGIRISPLGELYRPSFFYRGYAIHGNGSVPPYPASHGCVRIPDPVADRLFATLAVGTRVAVYDE